MRKRKDSTRPLCRGFELGLTERGLSGGGSLHTGAVVSYVVVGTGAHRPAGTKQTQPPALLAVTWIGSHWREREKENQEKHLSFSAA